MPKRNNPKVTSGFKLSEHLGESTSLTKEEEDILIPLAKGGDDTALLKIFLSHIQHILNTAKRFHCHNIENDDFLDVSWFAFKKAIENYEIRDKRFWNYACYYVLGEIAEHLHEYFPEELRAPIEQIDRLLSKGYAETNPERKYMNEIDAPIVRTIILKAISELPNKKVQLQIIMRFFNDETPTYDEIGRSFGVSKSQISQNLSPKGRHMRMLRRPFQSIADDLKDSD